MAGRWPRGKHVCSNRMTSGQPKAHKAPCLFVDKAWMWGRERANSSSKKYLAVPKSSKTTLRFTNALQWCKSLLQFLRTKNRQICTQLVESQPLITSLTFLRIESAGRWLGEIHNSLLVHLLALYWVYRGSFSKSTAHPKIQQQSTSHTTPNQLILAYGKSKLTCGINIAHLSKLALSSIFSCDESMFGNRGYECREVREYDTLSQPKMNQIQGFLELVSNEGRIWLLCQRVTWKESFSPLNISGESIAVAKTDKK